MAGGFRRFVRDVAGFAGWRLAWLMGLTVVAVAAEGVGLLLLVPLLDLMGVASSARLGGGMLHRLGLGAVGLEAALAGYVVLVAAAAALVQARGAAVAALRLDYIDHVRGRLHAALLGMEWRAFARLRGSDVTHALTTESARAGQGLEFLLRLAGWVVEIPVLLAVAAGLSPAMTAAAVTLGAVAAALLRPLNHRTFVLGQAVGRASQALQADIADDLAGMRVVRGYGLEAARRGGFGQRLRTLRDRQMAYVRASGAARGVLQTAAAVTAALMVLVAVRGFGLALADTLVLIAAFARLAGAAMRIQDVWRTMLHTLPAHAAVTELLSRLRAAAEPGGTDAAAPGLEGEIVLEAVSYRHADDGAATLHAVSAAIPARVITAVVGPSGAGKSTLVDLLLGLTAPAGGRILVDGQPLDGTARRAWRRRIGYVPQDSFLFHESVRANLTLWDVSIDETRLWAALERAAAADFVRALPHGLDTVVGDRGATLSGGERQRLALARALLREPDLLILDEATSALDAESERRVLGALEALRGRVTVVVVAHRASTVRGADRVVVLDGGRVVAAGSWNEVERSAAGLLARLQLVR